MWHVLRAELAYFRPWLLGGLGVAVGVVILVSVIFFAVGEEGPPSFAAAGIRGMFLILAPMVVAFIAQSYRMEERRARLLLMAPLTPRQIAGAMVLFPVALLAVGVLAAGAFTAAGALVIGGFELESLRLVVYIGGLMLMMAEVGLLVQEAIAAQQQRRAAAAFTGWAGVVLAALLLGALSLAALFLAAPEGSVTWTHLNLGNAMAAVAAMAVTVALYSARTDFTR